MLLVVLVGCVDPAKPGGAETGEAARDTALRDDTGGTDPALWEPDTTCTLSAPMTVDTSERAFEGLHGPGIVTLFGAAAEVEQNVGHYGCPTVTVQDSVQTISGDCDLPDWHHAGTWTETDDTITLDGVAFAYSDEPAFSGDGSASYVQSGDQATYTIDLTAFVGDASWSSGSLDYDGAWEIHRTAQVDGPTAAYTGWYQHALPGDAPVDYCLVESETASPTCAREHAGGFALIGDHALIVRYDPDIACDGCGDATLDGEPAGRVCW